MSKAETRLQIYPDGQYSAFEIADRKTDYSNGSAELDRFEAISAELTGFSVAELQATGNAAHLFGELGSVIGVAARRHFVNAKLAANARLADPFHGPLACNVIRMWYLGNWERLSDDWVEALPNDLKPFDEFGRNYNRVISARAYREGLAWPAIGTNPPAAKQPGFGSWAEPPR